MMRWFKIAIQNLWRRKTRTLVTAAGVAIGIAALFSLLAFERGYQQGVRTELDHLGAQILVAPKGCPYDAASIALHGASWPCYLKDTYLARIRAVPGVSVAAPMMMNAVYDDTDGKQSVYIGTDRSLLSLKPGWKIAGKFPESGDECLIGATVAKNLKLGTGSRFDLPGVAPAADGSKHSATICGVISATNDSDDTFIYIPLNAAQQLFKRPSQLTHILVKLSDPNMLEHVVGDLHGCDAGMEMNVVPLAHVFHTIQDLVNTTRILLGAIALVALLTAGAGVSNAVLMAVSERTREIGVLRAIGASRGDVFRLVWIETMLVCLLGGIMGMAAAIAGSAQLEFWLRGRLPYAPNGTIVQAGIGVSLICILCTALLGSAAGLLPAYRASTLSPVEAMAAGAR